MKQTPAQTSVHEGGTLSHAGHPNPPSAAHVEAGICDCLFCMQSIGYLLASNEGPLQNPFEARELRDYG